jgi:hypothetical protein
LRYGVRRAAELDVFLIQAILAITVIASAYVKLLLGRNNHLFHFIKPHNVHILLIFSFSSLLTLLISEKVQSLYTLPLYSTTSALL